MAILSLVCGVPSVLFDVKTRKNEWLTQFSALIMQASLDGPLLPRARELLSKAGEYPAPRDALGTDYVDLLRRAAGAEKAVRAGPVTQLLKEFAPREWLTGAVLDLPVFCHLRTECRATARRRIRATD
jgi:hypothetical protein